MTCFVGYPSLDQLITRLIETWPDHSDYVAKSFEDRAADVVATSEKIAACILKIADHHPDGLAGLCGDYKFLCEQIVLPEELFFRRHNRYRLSSFADAMTECYGNPPFMARYMNGLLVSNVLWTNHAHAIAHYVGEYLPSLHPGSHILEIGPGHGLFLYFASQRHDLASLSGWDVSPTSIAHTRSMLNTLGVSRPVRLALQNLFEPASHAESPRFDAIVMSELLEHLEDPVAALKAAMAFLKPRGTIWINVPANSPAPDHIFLVESPEHACDIARAAGLEIDDARAYPMTGATLEKARKRKLAISCVVLARRPE